LATLPLWTPSVKPLYHSQYQALSLLVLATCLKIHVFFVIMLIQRFH